MAYNPDRHNRRSFRLRGYDYSQAGAYFVTVCTKDRECLFGEVVDGGMRLNEAGTIVSNVWNELPSHFPCVQLDQVVVMPNHVHGIVVLTDDERGVGAQFIAPAMGTGTTSAGAPKKGAINRAPTLGAVVRGFKARVTAAINDLRSLSGTAAIPSEGREDTSPSFAFDWIGQTPRVPVWQRNYYEHIIRDDDDLSRIRQYIIDNPAQWAFDKENPAVVDAEAVVRRAEVKS
ncbi:MAG: transposase [Myxococcota bacterium]|jgi:REP element-mobilizing transposase RayT|nr:transposase [Myxococcota bacterium]